MNYLLHHRSHRYFSLFFIFAFFLVLPLSTTALVMNVMHGNTQSSAAGRDQTVLAKTAAGTEFVSNEILVKVKKTAKAQIKTGNSLDTGVVSLNKINGDIKATKFEEFVKPSRNSKVDADVFAWYKVTIGDGQEILRDTDTRPTLLWLKYLQDGSLSRDPKQLKKQKLKAATAKLLSDPNIEAVEFNFVVRALLQVTPKQLCPSSQNIPNDPYSCTSGSWGQTYPDLWGIKKINAENAWKKSTGSAEIVVADVDTGADRNHEDLAANMWTNPGESGPTTQEGPAPNCTSRGLKLDKSCNDLDNDGDGYVNDYYGWNFVNGTNDPMDDNGHGTHTAGTIGAVGNNGFGVVGVNWNVKIMALKFLDKSGSGYSNNAAKAITYAADHGARVINNSWGGQGASKIIHDAVEYAHSKNVVVVAAAGNSSADASTFSPANEQNVITVAATDSNDVRATFSNWGTKIDVAAPGVDVLSLRAAGTDMYLGSAGYTPCGKCVPVGDPNAKYYRANGTSMAAPHVAGLAALILANKPGFSPDEIKQVLRTSADDIDSPGFDINTGRGRISAGKALSVSSVLNVAISNPSEGTPIGSTSSIDISGSAAGPGFVNYDVSYAQGYNLTSWTNIKSSNLPVANGILATWQGLDSLPKGLYVLRVLAKDKNGNSFDSYRSVVKEPWVRPITSVDLPNAQFLPKISGDKVIWMDWRNAPGTGLSPFDIYMYDFSTKTERRVTPTSAFYWNYDISGSNVVYIKTEELGPANVYVFNLDTNVERQLTFGSDFHISARIYGNRVIYQVDSSVPPYYNFKLYDLNTNTEKTLFSTDSFQNQYVDIYGDEVAVNDGLNLRVLNLSTNGQTLISGGSDSFAIYGNYVAYSAGSDGVNYDLRLYDLASKSAKSIGKAFWNPRLNVFGNLIVWAGQESLSNDDKNIFSFNILNGQTQQITYSPAIQYFPVTDGNRIVWADERGKDWLNTKIYAYDPPTKVPILTDSDKDGFTDPKELYMGTDQNKVCGLNAWPPDIDGDGVVSILDLAKMASAFGSKVGDTRYNKRYDMNADGRIDILDQNIAARYFTQRCTNPVPNLTSPTPAPITCTQLDFDHDGHVTALDMTRMAKSYGTKVGDPNYNPIYDLNKDGYINRADFDIFAPFFTKKC